MRRTNPKPQPHPLRSQPGGITQEETMKIVCGNCQKTVHSEDELAHVFPDIPDLLQRISPGEPVPIGECPDCGALVHTEPDYQCSVCEAMVEETQMRAHLETHHPSASNLSAEEVRNRFRLLE
jgi:endogenous inhibitor of DNA gyrase (YacG/DUF329 family)